MAKASPKPPEYNGYYKDHRLTIAEARKKVVKALAELFAKDAILLTLNVTEQCIVHKFAKYLAPRFRELHVDVEYNGWGDRHPKYLWRIEDEIDKRKLARKEAYPDVLIHWRRYPVNVLVVEVKKTSNTDADARDIDQFKLSSFTAPKLPNDETFHYQVGLFLDILTGRHIKDKLLAKATWYVDGEIKVNEEELCPTRYDGP
ncbi:hypothetical protein [Blastopirellula marina]|uniref:Uncharacterized protein n=1 Tax=Blastopirellula marina DSM 3645 TaxID=314230 RepID=A3ZP51_9BACT|nr:hypothetical protein [Blastopirellula marina]EAQ81525.1 hypothetical protein DSM3645_28127 [Blastopirellula marina DSM 3645]